jgi:hypothetical protein
MGTTDTLCPTPACSDMKTPEHTEYENDDPEPANEGNIQMKYSYD